MRWDDIVHDTDNTLYTLLQYVRKYAGALSPETVVNIGAGQAIDLEEYIKLLSTTFNSYAVQADGVKTYRTLLNDLYVLLPSMSDSVLARGYLYMDDGNTFHIFRYVGLTSGFTFTSTYIDDSGIHNDVIVFDLISNNSKYYKAVGNDVTDMSLEVMTANKKIEVCI